MLGNSAILSRLVASLLVSVLGGLLTVTSINAAEGGPSDQHVITVSGDKTWNRDIMEPYWAEDGSTYTFYGLFLDPTSVVDSYSVDGAISLTIEDNSGKFLANKIYGINCSDRSGTLQVSNKIEIIGTSWQPVIGDVKDTSGEVRIWGINSNSSSDIISSADIHIAAIGKRVSSSYMFAFAHTMGSGISSEGGGTIINTGDITITTRGRRVSSPDLTTAGAVGYGIQKGKTVINTGNITIVTAGGTADSPRALASSVAYGIDSLGTVTNSGDITITARGGTASGPRFSIAEAVGYGISSMGGAVVNSGTIKVATQAGTVSYSGRISSDDARAYGIYYDDSGTLSSSGLITASAQLASDVPPIVPDLTPKAYQVFCNRGTLTINEYAMEVGHSQGVFTRMYEGQIGTGSGAEIFFDKTKLVVHVADNYQNGIYDIPRLWKQETGEQKKAQLNQFATAKAAIPDITVSLIPSTCVGTPQKIRLGYEPKESTPLKQALAHMKVESQIHSIIQNNLAGRFLSSILSAEAPTQNTVASFGIDGSTSNMVASLSNPNVLPAVTTKEAKKHSLFFHPVYVNSYDSATAGYSSNTYGFVLGYDYKLSEKADDAFIGVHAGYTRGDIRYTGTQHNKRKEFVDTYYGGVHGLSRLAEDFVFSGEASFFYTENEMRDDNPYLLGKADYNSIAIRAEAAVGYLWDVSDHIIVPELGLAYSWQHRDPFTTNNQNSPDVTYGTLDNNELYAIARVKWLKHYEVARRWMITPLLGVGVTQILTDGEISNTMRLGNATQMVVDQDENTTFTPEANITVSNGDYYAIAGYTGGFGGTTKNNMFWLQLGADF